MLTAVGDISFMGPRADSPSLAVFDEVAAELQSADCVIANLECVLTKRGEPVAGKCTLRGAPGWAQILRDAGVDLVSLANNHAMDYGREGLYSTMACLDEAGIAHVGGGRNIEEAAAPRTMEVGPAKIAFLARSSVPVSSRCFATKKEPGVAPFELDEAVAAIKDCRQRADRVVFLIHWGIENYSYPSPEQRKTARSLAAGGADVIIGHHPHVLQGLEYIDGVPVAYSLGNFLFDEFEWKFPASGKINSRKIALAEGNREGGIVNLTFSDSSKPDVEFRSTIITDSFHLKPATASLDDKNVLFKKPKAIFGYDSRWRLYAWKQEWDLRIKRKLTPRKIMRNLSRLKYRHIRETYETIRRSRNIVSCRSTNPYE